MRTQPKHKNSATGRLGALASLKTESLTAEAETLRKLIHQGEGRPADVVRFERVSRELERRKRDRC